jgi:poly-gamma-glutamate synthesis protein (capsule biosynthesis protein)
MSQEVFAKSYERIRYEITKFSACNVLSAIQYLRKYRHKKFSANPAIKGHFTRQRSTSIFPWSRPSILKEKTAPLPALRISMVGDIMWMRKGWGGFLSEEVRSFLSQRDIVLGNLETPVSPDHNVIECLPDLFSYNSPTSLLDQLAHCFTALSVVNNHCLDQGAAGLGNTIRELDARNILHAGACADDRGREYTVLRKNGSAVAFLAYAWGLNRGKDRGYGDPVRLNLMNLCDPSKPTDYALVEEHVRGARAEKAELIVCSLHWGHEFEMYPTCHMMTIARQLVARGVDVIMGHHPHVVQPFEIIEVNAGRPFGFDNVQDRARPGYRRAVIVYSLGNFVSAMYTGECKESIIFNIDIVRNAGGLALGSIDYIPVYCMRRPKGEEAGAYVVDVLKELRKGPGVQGTRELAMCLQDLAERLGGIML